MNHAIRYVILLLTLVSLTAHADSGSPFFLLSDASYGSNDTAQVRLEAQDVADVAQFGGVDVYVYRVNDPLAFLQAQKNLRRVNAVANYQGEGLENALSRTWDGWWLESRKAWRKLFSEGARQAVTAQVPSVRSHPLQIAATPKVLNPQYKPLPNHTLVDSFRYPLQVAKPIQPPKGVKLEGSSSEFILSPQGNVMIPLGKKKPGLYLVEATLGEHRALTMVFVSDAIAVTKVASQQMMVWVADRRTGKPIAGAKTVWTDGVGVLDKKNTDSNGLVSFKRAAPEKTYVYGEDPQGGVYVAENYYYDSEIYNTKLYAVTDRPLYRPGETVYVKLLGRTFRSARESTPVAAGELKLAVFDASGFQIANQTLALNPQTGSDTRFKLPEQAVAGGYELRFTYQGNVYGAAFRVAEYQKPHFEMNVLPAKSDFKTNEPVTGKLQLLYPNGKPVLNANIELTVRSQRLSMIEGDLGYSGQFPIQLTTASLQTDAQGMATFELPASKEPSRYILSALATDGAAYRVRATKEILIERGAATYTLSSERSFSEVGEAVSFNLQSSAAHSAPASSWEWLRLENRQKESGTLSSGDKLNLTFAEPGTYTISLRDVAGNIVGATSHYVSGAGVAAPQGSIQMVFDKRSYKPGDTASALITFPQKVDQALLTLERDQVEKTALLANSFNWGKSQRVAPNQWRVELPVKENYGPNITLSVVYVKGGEYVFQNLGLKVEQPKIEMAVRADKTSYLPGDKVTLDINAQIAGQAAAGSQLMVSVVDEMVYVLQPELAPNIFDFFYHPRRNNVRTSASLSFIAYDLAKTPTGNSAPKHSQSQYRAIKVLERPRREDKDTALWQPNLKLDANGKGQLSFIMPDSLTRWRITVRAINAQGQVGQQVAHVLSSKDFYLKWTSPNWMRSQDAPIASVALFNQLQQPAKARLVAIGGGLNRNDELTLKPGANFVSLPLKASEGKVDLILSSNGKNVDALSVPLKVQPATWQSTRSLSIPIKGNDTPLRLPNDASNIRVQFSDSAGSEFRRLMDDLIDYPYGCVEQTASRLIPYSLAVQSLLPSEAALAEQLIQQLNNHRFRLAQMAGPQATFGWWSAPEKDGDPLLTAYAYYADWHASRALKLTLPADHFNRLLEVYRTSVDKLSVWQRALMLYWMNDMGLPVRSMAQALSEAVGKRAASDFKTAPVKRSNLNSQVLSADEGALQTAMALLLSHYIAKPAKPDAALKAQLEAANGVVRNAALPLGDALLMLVGKRPNSDAATILANVSAETPTIDRSLTLLWSYRALGNVARNAIKRIDLIAPWQARNSSTGLSSYRWNGTGLPSSLRLNGPIPGNLVAVVQYDSHQAETSSLPVQLERRIYKLVPDRSKPAEEKKDDNQSDGAAKPAPNNEISNYKLELLSKDAVLKTDELYLDEIELTNPSKKTLRYGIVEAPLPPGSNAERSTWGIQVLYPNGKTPEAMTRARYQTMPGGYAVPVDELQDNLTIRHLLRVAQTGKFNLPPARYYRMYQAEAKALEGKARAGVEVR